MFLFTGIIQKKALTFLDTLGTSSISILEFWSFNTSVGGDWFQFPWSNETPGLPVFTQNLQRLTEQVWCTMHTKNESPSPILINKALQIIKSPKAPMCCCSFNYLQVSKLFNVFLCYQGNIITALLGDTLNSHDQKLSFCFVCCAICSFLPELHSGKWPTHGSTAWQMSGIIAHFVYVCLCMPKFINIHRGAI